MAPLWTGRRIAVFALASLPVAGMLVLLLVRGGNLRWQEAVAMALPMSLTLSMVCLSSWYLCRWVPLREGRGLQVAVAVSIAAAASAGLWMAASRALAALVAGTTDFAGLEEKMVRNENWLWALGALLYLISVTVHYLMAEVETAREARNREVQMAMLAREAELRALREQIRPHFLFNSLNSISALTTVDRVRAREMCVRLADFLRTSLSAGEQRLIPLAQELSIVRDYLSIEQVRFSRLEIEEHVEIAATAVLVPPLILQPLVENAVKHGVAQSIDGGTIRLEATVGENDLRIAITNTFDPDAPKRPGTGTGLANVRKRLATIYGGGARLDVHVEGGLFRVELRTLRNGAGV
ncbi:MAG: histidine kinase [Bryobacterales bacterium]|nr:histidine kinase [Bryobacterales bacterium]